MAVSDETVAVEQGASPAQSPLVAVTFQRNAKRKEKYLEAEPKVLGITQICFSVYMIISLSLFRAKGLSSSESDIPLLFFSLLIIVAGSVAVAAKNLHLPTLTACLVMQILACVASFLNMIFTIILLGVPSTNCWFNSFERNTVNSTYNYNTICQQVESIHSHFFAGGILIQACLLAISATLAAYCCKVVNCCGAANKMPVITIQSPADQQKEG
ncbi:uncharacterized protein LOC106956449 isoform X1 [Poecilia latipinna]|uniref:uncharacterized protein LOC106956449 isoform X1 n=1 Tax=Poecilia latipinna TaxID=48699 RepID=UPI00072DE72B|nr:PREDICTED: uncharacterized protein LOC106956449 isoform X1 [Poecilia latipinna]